MQTNPVPRNLSQTASLMNVQAKSLAVMLIERSRWPLILAIILLLCVFPGREVNAREVRALRLWLYFHGEPVADEHVYLTKTPPGQPTKMEQTGDDGRIIFFDLEEGQYCLVDVDRLKDSGVGTAIISTDYAGYDYRSLELGGYDGHCDPGSRPNE